MTRWDERQVAMLGEMGLRLWRPAAAVAPPAPAASPAAVATVPTAVAATTTRRALAVASPPAPAAVAPAAATRRSAAEAAPPPAGLPGATTTAAVAAADPVSTLDWAALEHTVAGCVACALSQRRTQTVFGAGHREAHWMFIGEAPGEQEDLSGEPFVGASGRLLDRMLAAAGLTREAAPPERQAYIANTVKCRPPGNRNPEPAELAACEAYLARQIALVRPRVIVALGRIAAHWLLATDLALGKLRGRVHRRDGVPLVVTYHPAYLLRNPEDKARAWDDLCLAREVAADDGATAAGAAAPASA